VKDAFGNVAPTTPKRRPGRPRSEAGGDAPKRTSGRPIVRDGQVRGRNGEVLTRNRVSGDGYVNEFDIPESALDPEWDTYWARASCHGKADAANLNELYDNGWRPASPKNYSRVMPDMKGKDSIERDGLILMERPMSLSQQALDEQRALAVGLREMQGEVFGTRPLPNGFDAGRKSRNGKFNASKILNRSLERAPREAKPAYEYAGADD